jgi:hypothetical protein
MSLPPPLLETVLIRTRWADRLGRSGASLLTLKVPAAVLELLRRQAHREIAALRPFAYEPVAHVLQALERRHSRPAARRQTRLAGFALDLLGLHGVPAAEVDAALLERSLVPGDSWSYSQVSYQAKPEPLPETHTP